VSAARVRWLAAAALLAPAACARPTPAPAPSIAAVERAVADSTSAVLERALADSAFPGAFAIVGTGDRVLARIGVGRIDWDAAAPRPDEHTLWDLASLTKVVGMTSAMMKLVGEGRIALDDPARRWLPELSGAGVERVTIRHLLTHTSGLPAWRPLYKEATSPESALAIVYATPLDTLPGARYVYSDLGAIVLGRIVERVSGKPLDRYLAEEVFEPVGMDETMYNPPASLRARIAPTEYDPWRQVKVHGIVHDENAFALGGVSGHAGLFSSGHDLARLAQALLRIWHGGSGFVPTATLRAFTTVQDSAVSRRALGWETPTGQNSAGTRMSPSAFGHTGFTGTSIWIDPARDLFVVLLTNRVNPTRENRRIGAVRTALADAVAGAIGGAPASLPSSR
jgi:CubicO group peptidase (beta-lactamase class C family)